jgi:hypothetical protein
MDDQTIIREIAFLKQYLEMQIQANEARHEQRVLADQEFVRAALSSNDKRLDSMNEFRAALTDQSSRMLTRTEFEASRAALADKHDELRDFIDHRVNSEIAPIRERMELIGKPNWALMVSVVSIFLVMIAGVWLVIGLRIDAEVQPVSLGLTALQATHTAESAALTNATLMESTSAQDHATSRADRAQLNERLRALEVTETANAAERRQQIATMNARLTEVETQFCANDLVRNLMHANDLRLFSMLWEKVFPNNHYPTNNAYYPRVCQENTTPKD